MTVILHKEPPAPAQVSLEELEDRICSHAARLASSTATWLAMIAEFDQRKGWVQWGIKSCAHWLSWACSVSPGAAREYLRVARALPELPLLREAFQRGELSYSKIRAVTRVAGLVDEQVLLNQARIQTCSQLERTVRAFRKVDGTGLDQQRRRSARWFWDEDGMLVVTARLPADEGALVEAALRQTEAEAHPTGDQQQTAADTFVAMARAALDAAPTDESGDDRHLVVLHADLSVMAAETPAAPPADDGADRPEPDYQARLHLENGPGVDIPTAQRIACTAPVLAVLHNVGPGEPLRVGRKTRKISRAQRRALRVRDGHCRYPGCHRIRHLEAHHAQPWSMNGPTDLENVLLLCRYHHMLLHEGGYRLHRLDPQGNEWKFLRPNGSTATAIPEVPLYVPQEWIEESVEESAEDDPRRIRPQWQGEPFHLAETVGVFYDNPKQAATPVVLPPIPQRSADSFWSW